MENTNASMKLQHLISFSQPCFVLNISKPFPFDEITGAVTESNNSCIMKVQAFSVVLITMKTWVVQLLWGEQYRKIQYNIV